MPAILLPLYLSSPIFSVSVPPDNVRTSLIRIAAKDVDSSRTASGSPNSTTRLAAATQTNYFP